MSEVLKNLLDKLPDVERERLWEQIYEYKSAVG